MSELKTAKENALEQMVEQVPPDVRLEALKVKKNMTQDYSGIEDIGDEEFIVLYYQKYFVPMKYVIERSSKIDGNITDGVLLVSLCGGVSYGILSHTFAASAVVAGLGLAAYGVLKAGQENRVVSKGLGHGAFTFFNYLEANHNVTRKETAPVNLDLRPQA